MSRHARVKHQKFYVSKIMSKKGRYSEYISPNIVIVPTVSCCASSPAKKAKFETQDADNSHDSKIHKSKPTVYDVITREKNTKNEIRKIETLKPASLRCVDTRKTKEPSKQRTGESYVASKPNSNPTNSETQECPRKLKTNNVYLRNEIKSCISKIPHSKSIIDEKLQAISNKKLTHTKTKNEDRSHKSTKKIQEFSVKPLAEIVKNKNINKSYISSPSNHKPISNEKIQADKMDTKTANKKRPTDGIKLKAHSSSEINKTAEKSTNNGSKKMYVCIPHTSNSNAKTTRHNMSEGRGFTEKTEVVTSDRTKKSQTPSKIMKPGISGDLSHKSADTQTKPVVKQASFKDTSSKKQSNSKPNNSACFSTLKRNESKNSWATNFLQSVGQIHINKKHTHVKTSNKNKLLNAKGTPFIVDCSKEKIHDTSIKCSQPKPVNTDAPTVNKKSINAKSKRRKYKKIKLEITIMFNPPTKSHTNDDDEDVSFLEGINIDEIVNILDENAIATKPEEPATPKDIETSIDIKPVVTKTPNVIENSPVVLEEIPKDIENATDTELAVLQTPDDIKTSINTKPEASKTPNKFETSIDTKPVVLAETPYDIENAKDTKLVVLQTSNDIKTSINTKPEVSGTPNEIELSIDTKPVETNTPDIIENAVQTERVVLQTPSHIKTSIDSKPEVSEIPKEIETSIGKKLVVTEITHNIQTSINTKPVGLKTTNDIENSMDSGPVQTPDDIENKEIKIMVPPTQFTPEVKIEKKILIRDREICENSSDYSIIQSFSSVKENNKQFINNDYKSLNNAKRDTPTYKPLTLAEKVLAKRLEWKLMEKCDKKCTVLSIIRKGEFSTIYHCKDLNKYDYTLKVMEKTSKAIESNQVTENLMKLQNEMIPTENSTFFLYIHNSFSLSQYCCYLMDYYPKNLQQALQEESPFHINAVQHLAKQLVSAVTILRINNIVHSDIKPAHVLLSHDNEILKLGGFDSAYHIAFGRSIPNIGTVNYRAPEIILGYSASYSIDVWATALVMHEMATGVKLFPGICNNEILYEQMSTLGDVPIEMRERCMFKEAHFIGKRFMRRSGLKGQDVTMISSFNKSGKLRNSLNIAYIENWSKTRSVSQLEECANKINLFYNLLKKMLVLHPVGRLPIELVYANPFIFGEVAG